MSGRWLGSISRNFLNMVMRRIVAKSENREKNFETVVFQIWDKIERKVVGCCLDRIFFFQSLT